MKKTSQNSNSKPNNTSSNGIRFSISDLSPPRSRLLPCLYSERAAISLYDALHDQETTDSEQLLFSPKIITIVAKTLAHFKSICDQYGVPGHQIDVFATAAMRSAGNRHEMLAEIKKQSGLDVKILEAATESLFGAMGARSGFDSVDGLFMDLGGGSCQMTYVDCGQKDYEKLAASAGRSIPYGAARLTNEFRRAKTEAESSKVLANLKAGMSEMYEGLKAQSPEIKQKLEDPEGVHIYMCGGGFRGYGSMLMHKHEIQPYPIPSISGFTVSGKHFIRSEAMLEANETDEKIYGLSKRRREQFPAITQVIEALIAIIPLIKAVTFCTGSNREGALLMKLAPEIRGTNPITLFPNGLSTPCNNEPSTQHSNALNFISNLLYNSLPPPPAARIFSSPEFLTYVAANIWIDMGHSDESNSSKALHITTTGILNDLPGLTHELRAVIALTLCARWGTALGHKDRVFHEKLRDLLGKEMSFLCEYVGTVAKFLAGFDKVMPTEENKVDGWALNPRDEEKLLRYVFKYVVIRYHFFSVKDAQLQSVHL